MSKWLILQCPSNVAFLGPSRIESTIQQSVFSQSPLSRGRSLIVLALSAAHRHRTLLSAGSPMLPNPSVATDTLVGTAEILPCTIIAFAA